jgi:hypothetical protein
VRISKTDLAWAAGIIDGEGCIYIDRSLGKKHATTGYTLRLEVTMGHKQAVNQLHKLFGGTFRKSRSFGKKNNIAWTWIVCANQAETTLKIIRPYLIIKAQEAKLALRFRLIRRSSWGRIATSAKVLAQREKFYWQLRKLKPRWRFYEAKLSGVPVCA